MVEGLRWAGPPPASTGDWPPVSKAGSRPAGLQTVPHD